ncbi:MAG TPA: Sec-independent protein translocase subunit TatA [Mycobacteriales bacterium]|nr:Sec-independent protein translocase subunit TatA [Mycobacteriales bacterium]
MGTLSIWHWLIVAIVVLALFGYKKLPDAARSVGRSMRIFKSEYHEMRQEDDVRRTEPTRPAAPAAPGVIEGEAVRRAEQTRDEAPRRQE